MRQRTQEITRAADGRLLVVTWEWNNGFNLVDSRPATLEEVEHFNRHTQHGLPVKIGAK